MSRRILPALTLALVLGVAATADAAVRPFVLAGGASSKTEKSDLNEMLDEYTIREKAGSWEAGGGLRFIPRAAVTESAKESPIEIRVRLMLGGGSLHDARFTGYRSDYSYRNRFLVSSREQFTYNTWTLGSFFSARLYDRAGFYLGPVLQTVKYDADRSWSGSTDCYKCGPAKDKATVRYGAVEAGAHYTLRQFPLRLEGFWVPKRFELSTTHIVQSENYTATFSSLKGSLGARVSWEF